MYIHFYKYQGAGNDFVIIDGRHYKPELTTEQIKFLCDRRFGIGADGLMLLGLHSAYDFEMIYFNSDGNESTMCGNGGRCLVAFAQKIAVIKHKTTFMAVDGLHLAEILDNNWVSLKMLDVSEIEIHENSYFLNTGSPHYVQFTNNLENKDVYSDGKKIRYSERFKNAGTNVNFVEIQDNKLFVRTYERGVENETLACGTGVTAAALASVLQTNSSATSFDIKALGGNLKVFFEKQGSGFKNIWLQGPATFVFEGNIEI